ncbi:hypothetical protein [Nitrospira sp. BLG_2]|uniref:hypothetical protein n=1 Tax=Nitrospira sp. BLG_2 TaxID=3397507 RepID=UPI003B99989D
MSYAFRKFLSISLVLCILAIGGLAQAQAAEHAGHHAQHQAATHGTLLCSWMCAAGTVMDSAVVQLEVERSPIALLSAPKFRNLAIEASSISANRGPPSSYSL